MSPGTRDRRRRGLLATPAFLAGSGAATAAPVTAVAPTIGADRDDPSRWTVTDLGDGSFLVTWRSPDRFPITSDRPTVELDGHDVGIPTVAGDGRTVQVRFRSEVTPVPADLDVVLSGDRLDVAGSDVAPAAAETPPFPAPAELGDDPATPGPYAVVTSDYELDPVPVEGMTEPIEMVGHVVEPAADAATGPRPLVLFLHGRHGYCYDPLTGEDGWEWPCQAPMQEVPSHLGYDYIQQVLASQGYATVSIRVNGINAQD